MIFMKSFSVIITSRS